MSLFRLAMLMHPCTHSHLTLSLLIVYPFLNLRTDSLAQEPGGTQSRLLVCLMDSDLQYWFFRQRSRIPSTTMDFPFYVGFINIPRISTYYYAALG